MGLSITIHKDAGTLIRLLSQIQRLADSEKEGLGFLPAAALHDAAYRQRLIAATADVDGSETFLGYILHSGVYPHAKVQQIAVVSDYRSSGVASALIRAFVSDAEQAGFMTIKAEVASDLPEALAFYAKNDFEIIRRRAGGQARNRTILVHIRQLSTDSLFSYVPDPSTELGLGVRRRAAGDSPFFAFDLNVYFDLVRERSQSANARRLFGAALGHDIRLAVADEFVNELRRTSKGVSDPIFEMALQLPRLPKADRTDLERLAAAVHELVFVQRNARGVGSTQAHSDARHLAHAALARASAFVTRDAYLLAARNELLSAIGIDVASLDELLDLLPSQLSRGTSPVQGHGFASVPISADDLSSYLSERKVSANLIAEFQSDGSDVQHVRREAILENERIVALGVVKIPKGMEPVCRLLVHVRPEQVDCDLFADFLLDQLVKVACKENPTSLELVHLPGQASVNSQAKSRGFFRAGNSLHYCKIALGRPLTSNNWSNASQALRRRTGFSLPNLPPELGAQNRFEVIAPLGNSVVLTGAALEDMLSPTVYVWPGREGVIVPITRPYADELLGTSQQADLAFIARRDAAFLSQRGYVNSPRSSRKMRPDCPILFYESKRSGNGRGAVVAVARIVDSVILPKGGLTKDRHRRLVVDSIDAFSASDDVLFTTFDNLFVLPLPVPYSALKKIDAIGRANLVSAVSLPSETIAAILTQGWLSDKTK